MGTHTLEQPHGRRLTMAEWASLPEDEEGELVAGMLEEEEVPTALHELTVTWVIHVLSAWLKGRAGYVFGSERRYALSGTRGRKPDVSVILPGSPRPPSNSVVKVPPDIMVEVVSPSPRDAQRDRVEKSHEYASFGVRFYWLIDPQLRTLEIYELGPDGRYVYALSAADGLITQVPGCDGLVLELDGLWNHLDAYSATEP